MRYYAAPMQGITTWLWRRTHQEMFGGVEKYYTPFFSPTKDRCVPERDWRDLDPAANRGVFVVPQLMTCRAEDFLWAAKYLADLGYPEVNLNLGCPSGTVVAKGKGSGFLAKPDELDRFFETVFAADLPIAISVKTRLGLREEDEFPRILAIYNRYPIAELTLHPRVQKDFYQKPIHEAAFARALPDCRLPLCYNGELRTAAQVAAFHEKYPTVDRLMFGRGIVADPALPRKLQGGEAASLEEIRRFTAALYEGYQAAYGSRGPAVQKMKELWFRLIGLFDEHERCEKRMRRLRSPDDYEAAEAEIFATCPLRTETGDFKP